MAGIVEGIIEAIEGVEEVAEIVEEWIDIEETFSVFEDQSGKNPFPELDPEPFEEGPEWQYDPPKKSWPSSLNAAIRRRYNNLFVMDNMDLSVTRAIRKVGMEVAAKVYRYYVKEGINQKLLYARDAYIPGLRMSPTLNWMLNTAAHISSGDHIKLVFDDMPKLYRGTQSALRKMTGIKYAKKGTPKWVNWLTGLKERPVKTSHMLEQRNVDRTLLNLRRRGTYQPQPWIEGNIRRQHHNFRQIRFNLKAFTSFF